MLPFRVCTMQASDCINVHAGVCGSACLPGRLGCSSKLFRTAGHIRGREMRTAHQKNCSQDGPVSRPAPCVLVSEMKCGLSRAGRGAPAYAPGRLKLLQRCLKISCAAPTRKCVSTRSRISREASRWRTATCRCRLRLEAGALRRCYGSKATLRTQL